MLMQPDPRDHADPTVVAVVGLGYWGPNLTRVLAGMPDVELKWLCDLEPQRHERLARRHPSCARTSDVQQVLNDDEVEAVLLATPVFTHYDLASACLDAGKHTLVEKPLATAADQAEQLVKKAAYEELVLMCGHTFIYSPPVRKVKNLIDRGELGEILFISSSRVNLGLHQRDVSVVWDLGPHDFSILQYWLGEMPSTVRGIGRDSIVAGIPDVAFVNLSYASGVVANVELSWLAPGKLRRTVIVGRDKMVVYEDGASEPVKIFDNGVIFRDPETFGEYHLSYRTGDILSPKVETSEPLHAEVADFISSIRNRTEPVASSELATDVVRVTEAADESLRQGGERVSIGAAVPFPRRDARLRVR
jgi:predicted dehydrogenase